MPQECEGNREMDQEGAAGDAGGPEQGGGQVSSSGIFYNLPRMEGVDVLMVVLESVLYVEW